MKEVKISEVIKLIKSGYTRWQKEEILPEKSIQRHYQLSFTEGKALFAHPKLKGIKTAVPSIRIIDDTEAPGEEPSPSQVITSIPEPNQHVLLHERSQSVNEGRIREQESTGLTEETPGNEQLEINAENQGQLDTIEAPRTVEETWVSYTPAPGEIVLGEFQPGAVFEEIAPDDVAPKPVRAKRKKKEEPAVEEETHDALVNALDAQAPTVSEVETVSVGEERVDIPVAGDELMATLEEVDPVPAPVFNTPQAYNMTPRAYRMVRANVRYRNDDGELANPLTGERIRVNTPAQSYVAAYDEMIADLRSRGLIPEAGIDLEPTDAGLPRPEPQAAPVVESFENWLNGVGVDITTLYPEARRLSSNDVLVERRVNEGFSAAHMRLIQERNREAIGSMIAGYRLHYATVQAAQRPGDSIYSTVLRLIATREPEPVLPWSVPMPQVEEMETAAPVVDPIQDDMSRRAAELMERLGGEGLAAAPTGDSTDHDYDVFGDDEDEEVYFDLEEGDFVEESADVYDVHNDEYITQSEFNRRQEQRAAATAGPAPASIIAPVDVLSTAGLSGIRQAMEDVERERQNARQRETEQEAKIVDNLKKINPESEDIMDIFK